jgi:hypothetical protein
MKGTVVLIQNKWHRGRRGVSKVSFMLVKNLTKHVKPSLLYFEVIHCKLKYPERNVSYKKDSFVNTLR